jgi:hypothetical protein
MKNRLLLYVILLVGVFLLGFVPQYMKSSRLAQEVRTLSWQNQVGTARDLIAMTFLEVSNNNFGVASQHATQFFDRVRAMTGEAADPAQRELLQQIDGKRDSVTAALAKADPAVRVQVQEIMAQTHQIGPSQALQSSR